MCPDFSQCPFKENRCVTIVLGQACPIGSMLCELSQKDFCKLAYFFFWLPLTTERACDEGSTCDFFFNVFSSIFTR